MFAVMLLAQMTKRSKVVVCVVEVNERRAEYLPLFRK